MQLDLSWCYHYIKGQSSIKLYVLFNMLLVFDRMCYSIGTDATRILFDVNSIVTPTQRFFDFIFVLVYCCILFILNLHLT